MEEVAEGGAGAHPSPSSSTKRIFLASPHDRPSSSFSSSSFSPLPSQSLSIPPSHISAQEGHTNGFVSSQSPFFDVKPSGYSTDAVVSSENFRHFISEEDGSPQPSLSLSLHSTTPSCGLSSTSPSPSSSIPLHTSVEVRNSTNTVRYKADCLSFLLMYIMSSVCLGGEAPQISLTGSSTSQKGV